MARARNLKPGFFKNEDLAECSAFARLCFAGLWTLADREGRLEDRPKRIKGELFSYDTVDVEILLVELVKWKFIERYSAEGMSVIQILQFTKHQTPHYKENESELPGRESPGFHAQSSGSMPEADTSIIECETLGKSQSSPGMKGGSAPPESLFSESLNPLSVGKPAKPESLPAGFLRFWTTWPQSERKESKGKCLLVWKRTGCEGIADQIAAHVEMKKASLGWTKSGGEFIPAPLVYLNKQAWEGVEDFAQADQRSFV